MREVFVQISHIFKMLFTKLGMNKSMMDRSSYVINLVISLMMAIDILACVWIYIGRSYPGTWIRSPENGIEGACLPNTDADMCIIGDETTIFITSVYWVITTLTTVGYGDYKGFTQQEYIFQMIVEFLGIGLFSFLMGSINNLVTSDQKLQDILDERIEDLDIWLRRLDKSRTKLLPKYLYDSIKDFVEKSFHFDYNLIRS